MKLTIIIPVYNEERTVTRMLHQVLAVSLPGGMDKQIIIVNDGSTDATAKLLTAYQDHPQVTLISHEANQGKASAVLSGIKKSSGNFIIIQDADLEYNPVDYPKLLEPLLTSKTKVVYGSRFLGKNDRMTLINRWANNFSTKTLNILYKSSLTDMHSCYKLFSKEVFDHIQINSSGFSFDTEVTCRLLKLGYQILEVPIQYTARSKREGKKITWANAIGTYFTLIKCRFG